MGKVLLGCIDLGRSGVAGFCPRGVDQGDVYCHLTILGLAFMYDIEELGFDCGELTAETRVERERPYTWCLRFAMSLGYGFHFWG